RGELRRRAHELASAWKSEWGTELVLTNGAGPIWFEEGGKPAEEPVYPAKALNPTGSGDAFTACLALALARGASLREAVREGSRAGALNAANLKPGSIL
ncbi:MAG TPA: PfkB family carbohydrate kinase, partial [Rectinemataceae bacterium]